MRVHFEFIIDTLLNREAMLRMIVPSQVLSLESLISQEKPSKSSIGRLVSGVGILPNAISSISSGFRL